MKKNQRANHICGGQIKNREWPLCDSQSSILFWARAKTHSVAAGRRRESTNKIRIIIILRRGGAPRGQGPARRERRLKEKDAQPMTSASTHQGPCPAKVEPLEHCRGVQSLLFTPACAPAMQRQSPSTLLPTPAASYHAERNLDISSLPLSAALLPFDFCVTLSSLTCAIVMTHLSRHIIYF